MPTLESIAAQTVASVGGGLSYPLVAEWVRARYQQLATRVKLKHLRQLGQVNIPAAITTGTATVVRDSPIVTISSLDSSLLGRNSVGWFFRAGVVWYEVLSYSSASGTTTLQLKAPYAEASVTAGAYVLVSRYTKLDSAAAWIGRSWVHARHRRPLSITTMDKLNSMASYRPLVGSGGPQWVAEGPELDGVKTVEIYPYSTTSEALFYVYWKDVPALTLTEELSSRIKPYILKEGALIDCYRYKMTQAADKMQIEAAAFYRNEMRTQETKWERYLMEAIQADQGEDDGQFILTTLGKNSAFSEIRTARDQVWSRT